MYMNDYISSFSLIQLENMGYYNYIKDISNKNIKYLNIIKNVFRKNAITSIAKGHINFKGIYEIIPKLNIYILNNKKAKISLFIIETNPNSNMEFIVQARSVFANKCNLVLADVKTIIIKRNDYNINEFKYLFISTSSYR